MIDLNQQVNPRTEQEESVIEATTELLVNATLVLRRLGIKQESVIVKDLVELAQLMMNVERVYFPMDETQPETRHEEPTDYTLDDYRVKDSQAYEMLEATERTLASERSHRANLVLAINELKHFLPGPEHLTVQQKKALDHINLWIKTIQS